MNTEKIKVKNLEGEIWLPVVGYEELYECSNLGRLKGVRFRKEHLMQPRHDKDGYLTIGLYKDDKQKFYQLHRIIGMAFIPNPNGLPEINHRDEIKDNNVVSNLEWCDRLYNVNYGTRTERASQALKKPVVCVETGVVYPCAFDAVKQMGLTIDKENIRQACRGIQKTAGGFHWCYWKGDAEVAKNKLKD